MISPRTVSAMKNMNIKYPLNMVLLKPMDRKTQTQIGNPMCETD